MNPIVVLVFGLLLFMSAHTVRIVADDWRGAMIARLGEFGWKGVVSLPSLLGFGLIVWGYSLARAEPILLWSPAVGMRYLATLLMLPAFVLLLAPYVPGNRIKTAVGQPMVAGTALWALAHLLTNGTLADLLLFGSFLVWAVISFQASRQRDQAQGKVYPAGPASRTVITVIAGIAVWALFATLLHGPLIGVRLFG